MGHRDASVPENTQDSTKDYCLPLVWVGEGGHTLDQRLSHVFSLPGRGVPCLFNTMLSLGGQDGADDILDVSQISALLDAMSMFATVSESGHVLQLGDDEGREANRMERAGDLSPNGAFGRCLVYRIDISQLSQVELSVHTLLILVLYFFLNILFYIILYYIMFYYIILYIMLCYVT